MKKYFLKNLIIPFLIIILFSSNSYASVVKKDANIGDIVKIGKYEQDNDKSNGKEEVEWKVLDIKDDRALLISNYILDVKQYNNTYGYITWANSTLRKFLNNSFYNETFDAKEQKQIIKTDLVSCNNPRYGINGGGNTKDNLFVLSYDEYIEYFGPTNALYINNSAMTYGTMYARAEGLYVNEHPNVFCNGFSPYWMRTPGSYLTSSMYVTEAGEPLMWGDYVNYYYGVRPCMWVKIEND